MSIARHNMPVVLFGSICATLPFLGVVVRYTIPPLFFVNYVGIVSRQEAIPLPFREGLGLGSPYAHACYHYGKLLRAKENSVEAMQAFFSATHSGTKDYHILGRVYSNIGSICHLAGEFQLSYDMYEKSADMFIPNCDSTAYFYA